MYNSYSYTVIDTFGIRVRYCLIQGKKVVSFVATFKSWPFYLN